MLIGADPAHIQFKSCELALASKPISAKIAGV
jgi:hypothetical protein